jgi:hypothetical protein
MDNNFLIKFRKLSGLNVIIENKVYPKTILDLTKKRLGISNQIDENKILIFGLFRNQKPFNETSIDKIKNLEELNDYFNNWHDIKTKELIRVKPFVDDENLVKLYLNAYIENIHLLGNNANPFSIKNVEKELVDVVLNNNWVKDSKKNINTDISIYNPDKSDVLYEDSEILILSADRKSKCVYYGMGESWCIGKPELNYYNTYRIQYGATIYYVLQKNEEYPEHKIVIMVYGDEQYAIADQSNADSRSGSMYNAMPWNRLENQLPNLKGKRQYFQYKDITDEEKRYNDLVRKSYYEDDLMGYIENITNGLYLNNSKVEPEDFIRDYVANNNKITDKQFDFLNDKLKNSIIETGYRIDTLIFYTLNESQKRRYLKIRVENGVTDLSFAMFANYLTDEQQEKYLEIIDENGEDPTDMLFQDDDDDYGVLLDVIIRIKQKKGEQVEIKEIKYEDIVDYYEEGINDKIIKDMVEQGWTDEIYFEYQSVNLSDLDYYIDKELLIKLIKRAYDEKLITKRRIPLIKSFDDLIPFIEGTEIEEDLDRAYNNANESGYFETMWKQIKEQMDDFISNNENKLKLSQLIDVNINDTFSVREPHYGFDSNITAKSFKEAYGNI